MIERYTRPEMARIWSEQNQLQKWLEVEILAAEALAQLGKIPQRAVARIRKKARFDLSRIREIEKEVRHDVIAFLSSVTESLGKEGRLLHAGMTSSDVLDTALAMQLKEASFLLLADIRELMKVIKRQALKYKHTPMIGRTHGVHAEPITFGLKLALWYEEMKRNLARLERAASEVSVGKISGAVGTFAQVSPKVEAYVCRKSGLSPAPISNQIVQRDRHAYFFATLAVIAGSLEKFAVEIRHLQRTEVLEAEEPFTSEQKGSSAMPHKRNPILSENVSGLARLMRSYAIAGLENIPLWHERDISHSSVERIIGPEATILTDFMLVRLTGLIEKLVVYPKNMKKNLEKMGKLVFSEGVLVKLIESGLEREEAYRLVQRQAMRAWEKGVDFAEAVRNDPAIKKRLGEADFREIFDLNKSLRHVDTIFRRVFG